MRGIRTGHAGGPARWLDPRGRHLGTWAFVVNRLTGLGLVAYLYLHLIVLSTLLRGPEAWDGLVGLFGPRDMASDLRERITTDIRAVASDPEINTRLTATGQVVSPGAASEFAASIEAQRAAVASFAGALGVKASQ